MVNMISLRLHICFAVEKNEQLLLVLEPVRKERDYDVQNRSRVTSLVIRPIAKSWRRPWAPWLAFQFAEF